MSQTQLLFNSLNQAANQAAAGTNVSLLLSQLLSINLEDAHTVQQLGPLQRELQPLSDQAIIDLVQKENLFDGDWSAFSGLVESYLKLCRDVDPSSILKSHDLFLVYFNDLTVAIMNNMFGNHLAKLFRETIDYIYPFIKRLDLILNEHVEGKKFRRLIFLSTCLSKLFNHLRSLKGWNDKKALIIFIVNKLNKIYFIIDNPLLCANIFTNMNLLNLNFLNFPKSEQCEYRFILGKYYLIKNKLFKSYYHLNWVFSNLHRSDEKNRIKVLRFLIPISILVGNMPSKNVISIYPELQHMYEPLIIHLVNGNHLLFQCHLFQNQDYFKAHSLLILLCTKVKVVIFRNLIRKVLEFRISSNNPKAFQIPYAFIQAAISKSFGTSEEQDHIFGKLHMYKIPIPESQVARDFFVENICISVIENDLMRGNTFTKLQTLVLSKSMPFPNMFEQYKNKFGIGHDEKWMDL